MVPQESKKTEELSLSFCWKPRFLTLACQKEEEILILMDFRDNFYAKLHVSVV